MHNVTARTKNDKLSSIPINLLSLASVKSAVSMILSATHRVDGVVGDAGLDGVIQPAMTADGFESAFQLEYIAHFYLVELLLPELRKTKGRVVYTSTLSIDRFALCMHSGVPLGYFDNVNNLEKFVRKPAQTMTPTITGNVFAGLRAKTLHAKSLAIREKNTGVTAYSFHPGMVATSTNFQAYLAQF